MVPLRFIHAGSASLLVLSVLPMVGSGWRRVRPTGGPDIRLSSQEAPDLRELRSEGNTLYRAGKYLGALRIYERGVQEASRRGDARSALRFSNNLGSADYQLLRYRDAIRAYLQARDLAHSQHDQETLAAAYLNLSSLYFEMGEVEAAAESAERGLELPVAASAKFRPKLLIQSALIQGSRKNWDRTFQLLQEAIEISRAQLDVSAEAQAWNELGIGLSEWGRLAAAERALLESFRLRKLTHDERLHFSYESLGELRLLQNDPVSALRFFDEAIQSAEPHGPAELWSPLYGRGKANLAQSRLRAAYMDFGSALRNLQSRRAEILPADAFRVSTEVKVHRVYSAYIELAGRLYRQTGQKRYAEESFAAAEEGRSASLRTLWYGSDLTRQLPEDYWQTLSDLQGAESALLRSDSNAGAVRRLRLRLTEMEASAGLDVPHFPADGEARAGTLLQLTRQALSPDEVYLGFHTGDSESCVWVVTRDGFEFRTLPPQADLNRHIGSFVTALSNSTPAATPGSQLYGELFGHISRRLLDRPTWVLAADGPLFELPFGALTEGSPSGLGVQTYVIQRHAIRIVPGILSLLRSSPPDSNELFVGVGDPIYNRADPRRPRATPSVAVASASNAALGLMELPRLLGSKREVESCADIWRANGHPSMVLDGAAATRHNLAQALHNNPSVLHMATHILFPPGEAGLGLVALSLQAGNQVEFLSATETASMRAKLGLVVLDGCSSGHAAILPGAGLMGLTRAWLVAGARAVISTRWPADDRQSGGLFVSLYRLYFLQRAHHPISFGTLLQEAQLAELQAGGRRADPAHWASYFCVERN